MPPVAGLKIVVETHMYKIRIWRAIQIAGFSDFDYSAFSFGEKFNCWVYLANGILRCRNSFSVPHQNEKVTINMLAINFSCMNSCGFLHECASTNRKPFLSTENIILTIIPFYRTR